MRTDTRTDDELLEAARRGEEPALAALVERHRGRLERMVKLRLDRRLQGRIDPADVLQEAYVALRGKFPPSFELSGLPFYLWLRMEVGQKLIDAHRFHLGAQRRDAGQEVSLHRGALPAVTSISLAEQLLGRLTTASQVAMRAELRIKVQEALNSMEDSDREVLVLRHFEELSNSETALVLGIKPSAACNRYVRALRRLQAVFQAMPGGLEGV
jgi:RNA polymerase sigma-70 factor (ECF subfamily)